MHPNASQCISMHPNASKCIRMQAPGPQPGQRRHASARGGRGRKARLAESPSKPLEHLPTSALGQPPLAQSLTSARNPPPTSTLVPVLRKVRFHLGPIQRVQYGSSDIGYSQRPRMMQVETKVHGEQLMAQPISWQYCAKQVLTR